MVKSPKAFEHGYSMRVLRPDSSMVRVSLHRLSEEHNRPSVNLRGTCTMLKETHHIQTMLSASGRLHLISPYYFRVSLSKVRLCDVTSYLDRI